MVLFFAILASAWLVSERSWQVYAALAIVAGLGAGLHLLSWLAPNFVDSLVYGPTGLLLAAVYIGLLIYCAAKLFITLLKARKASTDEILGALNLYLIIGFVWANVYHVLQLVFPGSFAVRVSGEELFNEFVYFSFVTLTTLGYGDIVPQSGLAKAFVNLQAIMGHMYAPLAAGYLVGLHFSMRTDGTD
jgi:hypothetical protein